MSGFIGVSLRGNCVAALIAINEFGVVIAGLDTIMAMFF